MEDGPRRGQRGPYHSSRATRQRIVGALRHRPAGSVAELARTAGLPWGTVSHHLRAMAARGEVLRDGTAGRGRYRLAERMLGERLHR